MKKINLLIFFGLFLLEGFSQTSVIRSKLSKIYFGINLPITRFDAREKLNSNDKLFGYKEYNFSNTDYDEFQAYFTGNPFLSYTQNAITKSISVPFKKVNDKSEIMQMYFYYNLSDIIFSLPASIYVTSASFPLYVPKLCSSISLMIIILVY
jgi:hypothetical protein